MKFAAILVMVLSAGAWGRQMTPEVEDSLHSIHPRLRAHWLKERGIDYPGLTSSLSLDSENMSCVGRWSYGPSNDIAGRISGHDTILFLARGSGISVLQFHGGVHPAVSLLKDIDCLGYVHGVAVQDSWLYVSTSGVEIYNIARPASPVKLSWTDELLNYLAVADTFLYTVSDDSFKVFNVSDRSSPQLVGVCLDSGYAVAVSGNKAFLIDGPSGMYIMDISNPSAPHRVGSWAGDVFWAAARRNLCYLVTGGDARFHILDVSNPSSPQEISSLGITGPAVSVSGNFAYLSSFAVIDIADSLQPGIVGCCTIPGGNIWTTGDYGCAFSSCDANGLAIVDYTDPVHPKTDTIGVLGYSEVHDISVDGPHAILGDYNGGAVVLNVADPRHPFAMAAQDTAGDYLKCRAAQLAGHLGYIGWEGYGDIWRGLYVVSFADSAEPAIVGNVGTFNPADAMILRDSFIYFAGENRFQVLSVLDSALPTVISSCSLHYLSPVLDACVNDSIVYVANGDGGVWVIDVAQPHNAKPIATYVPPYFVYSVAAQDTIAYVGTYQDLRIVNVSNPSEPDEIGVYPTTGAVQTVALHGNLAYVSARSAILDVSNPAAPREVGFYQSAPTSGKAVWIDSLIYVSSLWDGVTIVRYSGPNGGLEQRPGMDERTPDFSVYPNSTRGICFIHECSGFPTSQGMDVFDLTGRLVKTVSAARTRQEMIDLSSLKPGIYFIKSNASNRLSRITLLR